MVLTAYIRANRARSVHPTSSFHSIGTAAMNAANGSTTAAMLTLRWNLVTGLEATTQKRRSFRALATFECQVLVRFPQMPSAISDLLEAGRARARDAFAERMPRGFGTAAPPAGSDAAHARH